MLSTLPFCDRADAAEQLAALLAALPQTILSRTKLVVLGLPRGGVPLARTVALAFGAPLDVVLVRRLVMPAATALIGTESTDADTAGAAASVVTLGAIGEDDVQVLYAPVLRESDISIAQLAAVVDAQRAELEALTDRLRKQLPRVPLAGCCALIVDDGVVTGSTARAACQVVRAQGAAQVIFAVPAAPADVVASLRGVADELVVLASLPGPVGQYYAESPPAEVELLDLLVHHRPMLAQPALT